MPYNLPPPWNPGYVLPKNVRDEGLQRRAFVTKQMPRGTYDDPSVGTGGYVVPQYVIDEGYGQGTFTTKWQPDGTYNGPAIPHWLNRHPKVVGSQRLPGGGTQYTVRTGMPGASAMGDVASGEAPMPPQFETYGQRAAQALIQRVAAFPRGHREKVLRTILDKVDKSAWSRTQEIWKRYRTQGMAPAAAFPLALARALSTGIAAEIIDTGLKGKPPAAASLMGLGCYGCMAALAGSPMAMGFITAADGGGSQGRPTAGSPVPTGPAPTSQSPTMRPMITIAPFQFPASLPDGVRDFSGIADIMITDPYMIPDSYKPWIKGRLMDGNGQQWHPDASDPRVPWIKALVGTPKLKTILGMKVPDYPPINADYFNGSYPMAKTKHPLTGEDLGIYVLLEPRQRKNDVFENVYNASTNPVVMKVWLSKVPEHHGFAALWDDLVDLVSTIGDAVVDATKAVGDAVKDGLNDLGDLACDLLSGTGGQLAGAAAAGAAGIPPQAGVAGVTIAQQNACGQPPPVAPVVPVMPPQPSILPTVLLAGGAVAAVYLLSRKTRTP